MPKQKWIQGAVPLSHKGLLHKELGVKQGEKIPEKKIKKAEKSKNKKLAERARFAEEMKHMRK